MKSNPFRFVRVDKKTDMYADFIFDHVRQPDVYYLVTVWDSRDFSSMDPTAYCVKRLRNELKFKLSPDSDRFTLLVTMAKMRGVQPLRI